MNDTERKSLSILIAPWFLLIVEQLIDASLIVFYNSKNLSCIGGLSFFKISSHIFMTFEVKLE